MASMNVRLTPIGVSVLIGILILVGIFKFAPSSLSAPQLVDIREIMSVSLDLAEKGGQEIVKVKENQREIISKGKTLEGVKEYQTEADRNSNSVIVEGFRKIYGNKLTVRGKEGSILSLIKS